MFLEIIMGCLLSKVDEPETNTSKLKKQAYIEYVENIESLRQDAWNSLMSSGPALISAQTHERGSIPKHIWKIDTIQKNWDMTIKSWNSSSFSNSSVHFTKLNKVDFNNKKGVKKGIDTIDADEYFDKRVKDAREMLEISEGIKMPREDFLLSDNEQKLCLSLTLAIPSYEAEFIKKYPMRINEVCMSVFFVAAEQKDEEARLIYGQGFTTINQFKKSININA